MKMKQGLFSEISFSQKKQTPVQDRGDTVKGGVLDPIGRSPPE